MRTPLHSTTFIIAIASTFGCGAHLAEAPYASNVGVAEQAVPAPEAEAGPAGEPSVDDAEAPASEAEEAHSEVLEDELAAPSEAAPAAPMAMPESSRGAGAVTTAPAAEAARPSAPLAARSRPERRRDEAAADSDRGAVLAAPAGVRAGQWDDNANFREFQAFLTSHEGAGFHPVDVRQRRFLVVSDAEGRGVPGCTVAVSDEAQHQVTLPTAASGRAILFPRAEGLRGRELTATARCQGQTVRQSFDVNDDADGVVQLRLSQPRDLPARPIVDVAFVLDTTGSMSEEIAAVKDTIRAVTSQLDRSQVTFRLGMVEFRDIGDQFVTRVHPFNADLREFSQQVSDVTADGGGDTPENVNAGLRSAVEELAWRSDSVARLAFLVGDAPPHLDYQDVSYASTMREAAHRGIKVHTIAASGMDVVGQVVWRQVAQYTGGRNMFVLRGGAGPQSTGGGDPISSCGGTQTAYTSGNLDQLITGEIRSELAALNEDPLRIAGLHQDENAKPCHERLVLAR